MTEWYEPHIVATQTHTSMAWREHDASPMTLRGAVDAYKAGTHIMCTKRLEKHNVLLVWRRDKPIAPLSPRNGNLHRLYKKR
jgi:hypothetical protein